MKTLQRELGKLFKKRRAPVGRATAVTPKLRAAAEAAKCEVEPAPGGGFNVWPPAGLDEVRDPYAGDHYAHNARCAYAMIEQYAKLQVSP